MTVSLVVRRSSGNLNGLVGTGVTDGFPAGGVDAHDVRNELITVSVKFRLTHVIIFLGQSVRQTTPI